MTSVDTNILVRLLTEDDAKQFQKASALFETKQIFIPYTVLLESEWVLRHAYDFLPPEILNGFRKLLGLPNVCTANPELIKYAFEWYAGGLDFADALHLACSQNCEQLATFDKAFIKKSKGISHCSVDLPQTSV